MWTVAMSIALTCDCGARFELESSLAGQTIRCPECLQPMETPARAPGDAPPRTSLLALIAVVVALVGSFTIVGSAAAVLLGIAALVQLRFRRGRLVGSALAWSGILLGIVFTGFTILLIWRDFIPVAAWMRQRTTGAPVDTAGALEASTRDGSVILRRPSADWGRVQGEHGDDPAVAELQQKRDLLLANVRERAFIDVGTMTGSAHVSEMIELLVRDLPASRSSLLGEDDDPRSPPTHQPVFFAERSKEIDDIGAWQGRECVVDFARGSQTWRMLVRIYKRRDPTTRHAAYVLRAYAPRRCFNSMRKELEDALSTVQLPR
jgi:hypothetical protein